MGEASEEWDKLRQLFLQVGKESHQGDSPRGEQTGLFWSPGHISSFPLQRTGLLE